MEKDADCITTWEFVCILSDVDDDDDDDVDRTIEDTLVEDVLEDALVDALVDDVLKEELENTWDDMGGGGASLPTETEAGMQPEDERVEACIIETEETEGEALEWKDVDERLVKAFDAMSVEELVDVLVDVPVKILNDTWLSRKSIEVLSGMLITMPVEIFVHVFTMPLLAPSLETSLEMNSLERHDADETGGVDW